MEYVSKSEKDTQGFLNELDLTPEKQAKVFILEGELGAGKTTFVKGLEDRLKIAVKSPTFNIIKKYKVDFNGFKNLYHIDFYRINDVKGLEFDEIVKDPQNLIFIEWGSNVKRDIPKWAEWIYFENIDNNTRKIIYEK